MTEPQKKRQSNHYIDNKKFLEAIIDHKKKIQENELKGLPPPRLSNYIGECIQKIATKFSTLPSYVSYSFREEMIDDAIENCILYFNTFDPERSNNPFAYFTQVTYHAFLRRIHEEEKQRYAKYKLLRETIIHTEHFDELYDESDNHLIPTTMYDNINSFMAAFEAKEEKKKNRRKELKNIQKQIMENPDEGESNTSSTNRITHFKSTKSKKQRSDQEQL